MKKHNLLAICGALVIALGLYLIFAHTDKFIFVGKFLHVAGLLLAMPWVTQPNDNNNNC